MVPQIGGALDGLRQHLGELQVWSCSVVGRRLTEKLCRHQGKGLLSLGWLSVGSRRNSPGAAVRTQLV